MKLLTSAVVALRPAQWIKNLVVLAPLLFARQASDAGALTRALIAMGLFCLASSAIYVVNDLQDLESDRRHPHKARRPIASGRLPVPLAVAIALFLGGTTVGCAYGIGSLPRPFAWTLAGYIGLNLLYTIWLKRIVILDAMTLSMGFVLRVLAGAVVIPVAPSEWLLLCTLQLALFLAFAKRRHELVLLEEDAGDHRAVLRHYSPQLLDQIMSIVTTTTLVSYLLYTIDPRTQEKFGGVQLLYTVPFVLYGIFRYLYLVHQQGRGGDPTRTLLTDPPLLIDVVLWGATTTAILYQPWS